MGARAVRGRYGWSDWGSDTWDIEMRSDRQSITVSKKGYLLGTANTKAQMYIN